MHRMRQFSDSFGRITAAVLTLTAPSAIILAGTKLPIDAIEMKGSQYPREALIRASGLSVGTPAGDAEFHAAAEKLEQTGFFQSVQYRYGANTAHKGYAVTFTLVDDSMTMPARIDIPGVDENAAWTALAEADPLLTRRVPSNERAQSRYLQALESWAASNGHPEKLALRTNGGMNGANMTVVFEPAAMLHIEGLHFTRTRALTTDMLDDTLKQVALGSDYTEARFRQLLELNLRPLYEEHGYLSVEFVAVSAEKTGNGGVEVTTEVNEGRPYTLGRVDIDAPATLPLEEMRKAAAFDTETIVNWTAFLKSINDMERPLRRTGYIGVKSTPERRLDDENHIVYVTVHVRPGPQFHFGRLDLNGLPPDVEQDARRLWQMRPGDPFDGDYPREFLGALTKKYALHGAKISAAVKLRPGESVADCDITFRQ